MYNTVYGLCCVFCGCCTVERLIKGKVFLFVKLVNLFVGEE